MKEMKLLTLIAFASAALLISSCDSGQPNPEGPEQNTTTSGINDTTLDGSGAKDLGTTTSVDNTGVTTHGGMGTTSGTPPGQNTDIGEEEDAGTTTATSSTTTGTTR